MGAGRRFSAVAVLLVIVTASQLPAAAYSVLSHELVVDLVWADALEPQLRQRFPSATPDDLVRAHAFAYGGSIIQDMGYYPFGSQDFSNLAHYVRSGDFVLALLRDAQNVNEYAFALGALAHYAADTEGHPAVNRAVADEIPKLRKRYGRTVTYADDPKAHIRVEFGFDVAQVAKQRFPPDSYHNFIGFEVCQPLLERAFRETYGLELKDIFKNVHLAIGSYRYAISKTIPGFTRAALATHRAELTREVPDFNRRKFVYRLKRAQYEQAWGRDYQRPGFGARFLAFLFRLLPKVGPLKAANFKAPTPRTEDLYFKSMNQTIDRYRAELRELQENKLDLPNRDFDTGRTTRPCEYDLTDDTYAVLLHKLAGKHFRTVTPELRANVLAFYADTSLSFATKRHPKVWQHTLREIDELRATAPAATSEHELPTGE